MIFLLPYRSDFLEQGENSREEPKKGGGCWHLNYLESDFRWKVIGIRMSGSMETGLLWIFS
ncbi:hypothetical protein CH359_08920 [Leptospira meyeri]|nr:hypothetical protein CH359_08920 [Leptospira meyeri]PJZ96696.1 hypothetical protein CH358_10590 [Leptospira meyeri]